MDKRQIKLTKYAWPDEVQVNKKKRVVIFLITIGLVLSFASGYFVSSALTKPVVDTTDLSRLERIMNTVESSWYFGKDVSDLNKQLVDDAISGMLDKMGDKYTTYFTKDELTAFYESINMGFVGIGVSYFESNGVFIINRVFLDSPAYKAGVLSGDIIATVDGVDVKGKTSEDIVKMVRGTDKSVVGIDFIRDGLTIHKDITRGVIENTTFGKIINSDTAYLEIFSFGNTTSAEVSSYFNQFKSKNITKIIIDLRDNGGGALDALEGIANQMLPKDDIIIQQEYLNGTIDITRSVGGVAIEFTKIVILVNENTASASEVLSAALQENLGAIVVGTKTYGKGLVQTMDVFSDGTALKFTVAAWLTPEGNTIQDVGVPIDVEVKLHQVFYETFDEIAETDSYAYNSVSEAVKEAQLCLDFLGYPVDRMDGYFSSATETALSQYFTNYAITKPLVITKEIVAGLRSAITKVWYEEKDTKDLQLKRALELVNE